MLPGPLAFTTGQAGSWSGPRSGRARMGLVGGSGQPGLLIDWEGVPVLAEHKTELLVLLFSVLIDNLNYPRLCLSEIWLFIFGMAFASAFAE